MDDTPFHVEKVMTLNDCCSRCTAHNTTTPICNISVFSSSNHQDKSGTCSLYSSVANRAVSVEGEQHNVCFLPSARNPPPVPLILDQAGIVVGDLKLVTGASVSMASWTGA